MNNWLLLVSCVTFMSLNVVDAVMTRIALRKGHQELMRFTKALVKELGLDRAMLLKSLLPTPFVIFVIMGWNNAVIASVATVLFMVFVVYYSSIVAHNCMQLLKSDH